MTQTYAISQATESLSQVEEKLNLVQSLDDDFFVEWFENLPALTDAEKATLDHYKQRFLAHRRRGDLSEGTVDRLLVSPLLDLSGLYESRFVIDSEASVEVTAADDDELYRGRIDVLVIEHRLWVLVVEEKATRIDMETAIPQALTYMVASPNLTQSAAAEGALRPLYGLVTNGNNFAFLKLQQRQQKEYAISDTFSLRSRQNKLYKVLQVLKQICDHLATASSL